MERKEIDLDRIDSQELYDMIHNLASVNEHVASLLKSCTAMASPVILFRDRRYRPHRTVGDEVRYIAEDLGEEKAEDVRRCFVGLVDEINRLREALDFLE